MKIIGLTGGIAAGKSAAAQALEQLGARIIDADAIAHALTRPGEGLVRDIAAAFGAHVLAQDGSLDRAALAKLVFFDETQRKRLEALMHPRIEQRMTQCLDEARADGIACAALVVPLLFEAGLERLCDEVWVVDTPVSVRMERLGHRGLSHEEAQARIASQMPDDQRMARANKVLDGSGSLEQLKAQTTALWMEALA